MRTALLVVCIIILIVYLSKSAEGLTGLGGGEGSDINDRRRVYFHYTNWCPYCRTMKPVWEMVRENLATTGIEFTAVNEEIAKTPYITAYPTIIMLTEKGKRVKYPGAPDYGKLRQWILSPQAYTGPP